MELKLVIEIEEGSKPIIKEFSRALMALGNTTTITNPAGTVVGKIQKFMQPTPAEDEYVKQEMGNWQTNNVKETKAENSAVEKSEDTVEKPQKVEKKTEEKPKEEVKVENKEAETPKKEEAGIPSAAVPTLTLEQLRAGCAEMSRLGKGAELRGLIREVYAVQKLDDLDPKNYESFANDLRELGVRI